MGDHLTTENHGCFIERKGRIGEARDVLEDIGSNMKYDRKGARNEYLGLLLLINQ
jgi:curved DNA-binding protein CbpA